MEQAHGRATRLAPHPASVVLCAPVRACGVLVWLLTQDAFPLPAFRHRVCSTYSCAFRLCPAGGLDILTGSNKKN